MATETRSARIRLRKRGNSLGVDQLREFLLERFHSPSPAALDPALIQVQTVSSFMGADLQEPGQLSKLHIILVCGESPVNAKSANNDPVAVTVWTGRIWHLLGANVVLVHSEDLDEEPFVQHQLDLTSPKVLDFLPAEGYDCASVAVQEIDFAHPAEANYIFGERAPSVSQQLAAEILRLVRDGGLVVAGDQVLRKHGMALIGG